MKVFISSTYKDLKSDRQSAIAYIDRIGRAIAMEKFFASNHQSKDVCLKQLQECDALVLILGSRYGSIDPSENISITEIEYNTAKALGLPVFVFPKTQSDGNWQSEETDFERQIKHLNFKSRLDKEKYRVTFATSDQLSAEIMGAIYIYEKEHGSLGVRLPAFTTFENFFRPFIDQTKLFNHTYPLVGMSDFLEKLNFFAASDKKIGLLWGRGGVGKSKIIFEFGAHFKEKHPDYELRFLKEEIPLTEETVRQLPAQRCVVVVDDAHRREDLKILFAIAQQYPERIKIVLSCRPQGVDYIKASMTQTGFDTQEIEDIGEIKELDHSQLKELGRVVLGKNHLHLLKPLIQAAKDSPLVIVVGGRLLVENAINPALLERHVDFQRIVFDRFQDVLIGQVTDKIPADLCKGLLAVISALSPIRPQNDEFQKQASRFLGIDNTKLIEAIGILEEMRILLRRGHTLRITPDVLSDHILYNICLTPQGEPTGYAKKVFDAFVKVSPENVLSNLSELDWRIIHEGKTSDLLTEIWKILEKEFYKASHFERCQIIKWLEKVAYFQPSRTLTLVEYAIRNPSNRSGNEEWAAIYQYSQTDVIQSLTNVLRQISYNLDYLPRCFDLLWILGRDDQRETNPHPEHAMRVLCDIASYDIGKPVQVNRIVLEAIGRWLKEPSAHNHIHSPLDVIDPLLAKEGESHNLEGHSIAFRPFAVTFKNTKPIRNKAIAILEDCTKSSSPKVILRSLKSLTNALRKPHGLFGRVVSDEELNQWLPEQLHILEILKSLVQIGTDPIIQIQISSELQWYAKHSSQNKIKQKAREIINLIPDTFEIRLVRAIWNRYDRDWDGEDFEQHRKRVSSEIKQVATEFLVIFPKSKEAFDHLNNLLLHFQSMVTTPQPGYFLSILSDLNTKMAEKICNLIISKASGPLAIHLGSFLYAIRKENKKKAKIIIKSAIQSVEKSLCLSIGHAYAWGDWVDDLDNEEIEMIEKLLKHADREVRLQAMESLRNFKEPWEREAINLAIRFDVGEDEKLADALCSIFDVQHGISPDLLSYDDLSVILSKFVSINKLENHLYHIDKFIGYITSRHPILVVRLFLQRLDKNEQKEVENKDYQPMPYLGFRHAFKGISFISEYSNILREIRDRALKFDSTSYFWLRKLFKYVSEGYCKISLDVLAEWVDSGEAKKIEAVAILLKDAEPSFIFREIDFVSHLLESAYSVSDECYRRVSSDLLSCAIPGTRSGTSGQPMPQDVTLRDKSKVIIQKFPPGSPTFRFFNSLIQYAKTSIQETLARDEEF